MDDFDVPFDLVDLSPTEELPNLDHWKSVMEFTVEQAALLMAGIDPFDATLEEVKSNRLSRWKHTLAHSLGVISAIRQGLITPVACYSRELDCDGLGNRVISLINMKPSDRTSEISILDTMITRASLIGWITTEQIQITRPPRKKPTPPPPIVTYIQPIEKISEPLVIPYYGHTSEGLEFVDDAIKQFWSTYDSGNHTTAPSKDAVVQYLKSKGATGNVAEAVDKILRPQNMRKAHLKNHKVTTRESQ